MDLSCEGKSPDLLLTSMPSPRESQPERGPDREEAEMLLEFLDPA